LNKTVVVELDQNGKEIFHTAGYEKYWISRVGMETVWLRKERVKEVVSVQETFAAMEFLEKPERGIVSAEISIRMKMTDESCRWTRVGYEIMMPDNGTDKKVVVTFTDEEKEKQSEAEYAEVIRERDNLILTISGGIAIYEITDKIRTVYITEETAALAGYTKKELMEIMGKMRWHYAIPMILKQRRIILKQEDNRFVSCRMSTGLRIKMVCISGSVYAPVLYSRKIRFCCIRL